MPHATAGAVRRTCRRVPRTAEQMTTIGAERRLAQFREQPLRPGDPRLRPKGRLLIIGGHEDKKHEKIILRRFVQLVGRGKIVVATIATSEPRQSWNEYERVFRGLGAAHVHHLAVEERAEADALPPMKVLEDAAGVFFTGGDQLKITSVIGDTPVFSRIHEILLEGGVIAGTSAGASVMTETMLVGGGAEHSHRIEDNLRLAPGLGFAKDMVVDQHFAERGRINRLLAVIAQNPRIIAIGIDENTAVELRPNRAFRVIGEGGVTVLDGRGITYTNVAEATDNGTLTLFGVKLHLLSQGDRFDVNVREPDAHPADVVNEEVGVGHDGSEAADD
jgi:cyanophycinase